MEFLIYEYDKIPDELFNKMILVIYPKKYKNIIIV